MSTRCQALCSASCSTACPLRAQPRADSPHTLAHIVRGVVCGRPQLFLSAVAGLAIPFDPAYDCYFAVGEGADAGVPAAQRGVRGRSSRHEQRFRGRPRVVCPLLSQTAPQRPARKPAHATARQRTSGPTASGPASLSLGCGYTRGTPSSRGHRRGLQAEGGSGREGTVCLSPDAARRRRDGRRAAASAAAVQQHYRPGTGSRLVAPPAHVGSAWQLQRCFSKKLLTSEYQHVVVPGSYVSGAKGVAARLHAASGQQLRGSGEAGRGGEAGVGWGPACAAAAAPCRALCTPLRHASESATAGVARVHGGG